MGEEPAGPIAAPRLVKPGLGMSRPFLGVVGGVILAASVVSALAARSSPVAFVLTLVVGLAVVAAVAWRTQRDLRLFKVEHSRWPREDELDAWNAEVAGRREKAKRVAIAAGEAKGAVQAHAQKVAQAEHTLATAQRSRNDALMRARAGLGSAEQAHANALASATSSLEAWRNPGRGNRITSFKGVELYQHAIRTRRGDAPVKFAQAMVAGNLLTLQAGGSQEVFKLSDKEAPAALRFASQIQVAASAEVTFEQQRPAAIPAAEQRLAAVVADTAAIQSARAAVVQAEADTSLILAIQEAERAVAAAKADSTAVLVAQAELKSLEQTAAQPAVDVPPPTWLPRTSNALSAIAGIVVIAVVVGGAGAVLTAPPASARAPVAALATPAVTTTPTLASIPSPTSTPSAAPVVTATVAPTEAPAPTPAWPADYQTFVCAAVQDFTSTGPHTAAISSAAAAFDLTTLASEADQIAGLMQDAQSQLAAVPEWAPGDRAVSALSTAAADYRLAANEIKLGAQNGDATLLGAGGDALTKGNTDANKATADLVTLVATTGFACS